MQQNHVVLIDGVFMYGFTSTGLATLRRDGFVSMHTDTEGVLVTEKIKFDGNHFFVNGSPV